MESDYPDGLPAIMSSNPGCFPDGTQGAPLVTGYENHEDLFQPFFLQQSIRETADGTHSRHHSQRGLMLQNANHMSTHHPSESFQSFSSPHQRASIWAVSTDVPDDFESCSSRASSRPCASSPVLNSGTTQYASRQIWSPAESFQGTPWMQSPELAQEYKHYRRPLSVALEDLRFPPASAMVDSQALGLHDSGYRSSTSHPNYMPPLCDGLPSALSLSPGSTSLIPDDNPLSRDNSTPLSEYGDDQDINPDNACPAAASEPARAGSKEPEPYAQLIYKAFMSHPRHAMTLQEIYQWFRENTDKAKSPGKGWQNSIRHNLSMNRAFQKQDKKFDGSMEGEQAVHAPASGDSKKSSEWFLTDWAVDSGVQSTTRYRKGNSSRRVGPGRQTSLANSARRSAGRQGGVVASRTKESHRRRQMMQEAQRSSTSVPAGLDVNLIEGGGAFGTFPVSLDQNRYTNLSAAAGDTAHRSLEHIAFSGLDGRAIRNPPTVKSEDEPITPEAEDLLVLHGSATSYAYEPPRHGLVHSAYTYDDVTGMYPGSPSSTSRIPPLFIDPDEVPESLHLLSEYPNSTCAWTNSDMGSSEINF